MKDRALNRLRDWLEASRLPAGARLPPERRLAGELNMTRSELRKALQVLELEGQLSRHVGRGTFLSQGSQEPASVPAAGLLSALAERTGPHEAMVARLAVEPEIARLAALHATALQLSTLKSLAEEMRGAQDWDAYEDLDAAFHELVAESTGNPLLHEVMKVINSVRKAVVWGRLYLPEDRPTTSYHSFAEHDAIVAALERRDRSGARNAMRIHIEATLNTMMDED